MIVLVTGATGFIGRHLTAALAAAGHEVVAAARTPPRAPLGPNVRFVHADFTADLDPAAWLPRLAGVDAVVNAAGILREHGRQTYVAIHLEGPRALFTACAAAGVRRIVQISALGADARATSGYHLSKRAADAALEALPTSAVVVQPSLVYGPGGRSATLFEALAAAPLVPLPGDGGQRVQPVHVDDLVAGVLALLASGEQGSVPFVGPEPLTLREMLAALRAGLGLPRARFLRVPMPLVRAAAATAGRFPSLLLDREVLGMLLRGNVGDPARFTALLGRAPRPVTEFVTRERAHDAARAAKLRWLLPVLRCALALTWLGAGIVSLGLYPTEASLALLARVGATSEPLAYLLLYGAALLDIALGVATLAPRRRRELWLVQIAVIVLYSAIITVRLPALWLEPFGPVLKNLPLVAALWLLYELDER